MVRHGIYDWCFLYQCICVKLSYFNKSFNIGYSRVSFIVQGYNKRNPGITNHEVVGGVYWFHSIQPSVRPSLILCPLCGAYSSGRILFILYILSSNFRRCIACKVSCKIWNFGNVFKICSFDFVMFWFGIWCESLVWVIMGQWGVSQNAGILVVLVQIDVGMIKCKNWGKCSGDCCLPWTFILIQT